MIWPLSGKTQLEPMKAGFVQRRRGNNGNGALLPDAAFHLVSYFTDYNQISLSSWLWVLPVTSDLQSTHYDIIVNTF